MSFERDESEFLAQYPEYAATAAEFSALRGREYGRLDATGQAYLDYTGGSLYAQSQLQGHMDSLAAGVFGNPHSANRASVAMTERVESARRYAMRYFNADPAEWVMAFTLNASGALKLIGESYPFAAGGRYLLTFDNHNSVNGIREFAHRKGAEVEYAPLSVPELRLDREKLEQALDRPSDAAAGRLFAFPAQSNFSGVKHPLELVSMAKARGWDVLLDAAAFVPTNRLDLTAVRPDFAVISFYKMFGYPTGVGALFVRRETLPKLRRPWFAGGTVNFASVQARAHVLASDEAAFEDGTVNYLALPAVEAGLRYLESVGVERIGARVRCLTEWLLDRLVALRHSNGRPMARIYGPITSQGRGATVTLNFYDPDGHLLDYRRIEELANEEGISLRTGCFCNPGAGETAEGLTERDMRAGYAAGPNITLQSFLRLMREMGTGKSAGAIRASFGIASDFRDAWRFALFAESFRDQTKLTLGDVTFDIDSCRVIRDGS